MIIKLAYAAGLLDGEGSINLASSYSKQGNKKYHRYRLQVCIVNTDPRMCYWLKDHFGGAVTITFPLSPRKIRYTWRIQDGKAEEFIKLLRPYSIIKCEQIDIAIAFRKTVSKSHKGNQWLNALNQDEVIYRDILAKQLKELHC